MVANTERSLRSVGKLVRSQPNEWKHWELNKNHPEITWDKFNEWIYDTRALERIQPNEDAMHVVEHCKSLGYRTGIVTARAYYPKAMKVTRQWVNKHKLPIDQIYCVSPEVDKRLTLDALKYPVKIYVDDHPEHIISAQLSDNVDKPIILTRPWNDTHDIEHRIDELADVIDHF